MTKQINWEANEISMLSEGSIHAVLAIQIRRFQVDFGSLPEVIYVNSNCQMAFVVELIKLQGLPPEAAVIAPVWVEGFGKAIPLLYSPVLGEVFIQQINSKLNAVMNL